MDNWGGGWLSRTKERDGECMRWNGRWMDRVRERERVGENWLNISLEAKSLSWHGYKKNMEYHAKPHHNVYIPMIRSMRPFRASAVAC